MNVPDATPRPPAGLSAGSRSLWLRLVREYEIRDAASVLLLTQLCEAHDGLHAVRAQIKRDGLMVKGSKGQMRPHPLIASETQYRAALLACMRALRLDVMEAL